MPELASSASVVRGTNGGIRIDGEDFPWYTATADDGIVSVDAHRGYSVVWIPVVVAGPVIIDPTIGHPTLPYIDRGRDDDAGGPDSRPPDPATTEDDRRA